MSVKRLLSLLLVALWMFPGIAYAKPKQRLMFDTYTVDSEEYYHPYAVGLDNDINKSINAILDDTLPMIEEGTQVRQTLVGDVLCVESIVEGKVANALLFNNRSGEQYTVESLFGGNEQLKEAIEARRSYLKELYGRLSLDASMPDSEPVAYSVSYAGLKVHYDVSADALPTILSCTPLLLPWEYSLEHSSLDVESKLYKALQKQTRSEFFDGFATEPEDADLSLEIEEDAVLIGGVDTVLVANLSSESFPIVYDGKLIPEHFGPASSRP